MFRSSCFFGSCGFFGYTMFKNCSQNKFVQIIHLTLISAVELIRSHYPFKEISYKASSSTPVREAYNSSHLHCQLHAESKKVSDWWSMLLMRIATAFSSGPFEENHVTVLVLELSHIIDIN
ncbi:hypothetical protein Nepgr_028516 [Nepenthes gracilis]|uniref:Uncharacterized protein n=1 Tax=Nepenthes gracilis TaxID=150966 RepID=A0AAD3TAU7_NEPGR|nr:hypothetical protein Nepgr_028516 [Nepenthes gracilis]